MLQRTGQRVRRVHVGAQAEIVTWPMLQRTGQREPRAMCVGAQPEISHECNTSHVVNGLRHTADTEKDRYRSGRCEPIISPSPPKCFI